MRKSLYFMAACIALTSCSAPFYGNDLSWRPRNYGGAPYVITNKFDHDLILGGNILHLYVNGDEVINAPLSPFDNSGSFVGKYKGHMVTVTCMGHGNAIDCQVFIDSEKVGTF